MQSLLVELEHFRELLKYVWTWPVSSSVLGHGITAARFPQRFSGCLSQFVSVQAKPILFFILPWTAIPPSLAHFLFLGDVKQVMGPIQLLR
jgi:hypothetical protein